MAIESFADSSFSKTASSALCFNAIAEISLMLRGTASADTCGHITTSSTRTNAALRIIVIKDTINLQIEIDMVRRAEINAGRIFL
jgi:hypothetical protein